MPRDGEMVPFDSTPSQPDLKSVSRPEGPHRKEIEKQTNDLIDRSDATSYVAGHAMWASTELDVYSNGAFRDALARFFANSNTGHTDIDRIMSGYSVEQSIALKKQLDQFKATWGKQMDRLIEEAAQKPEPKKGFFKRS